VEFEIVVGGIPWGLAGGHRPAPAGIDVAAFEPNKRQYPISGNGGGVATALWAPAKPTLAVETTLPDVDDYAVRIYDVTQGRRLVAAVEIVSPSNKDRPQHRSLFVA
jgi:hypothetical protein